MSCVCLPKEVLLLQSPEGIGRERFQNEGEGWSSKQRENEKKDGSSHDGWTTYLLIESIWSCRIVVGIGSDGLDGLLVGSVGGALDHVEGVSLFDSYQQEKKFKAKPRKGCKPRLFCWFDRAGI